MFRILHLSDLHIRANATWSSRPILADAKRTIIEQSNQENINAVAFTGDIAFGGRKDEYSLAADWLDNLILNPSGLNLDPKGVMFVPGNHDVNREEISPAATAIEDALRTASEQAHIATYYVDSESRELLERRHAAYFDFCRTFTGSGDLSKSCWSRVFEHSGKRIRFDGFNSSWLCRGADDHRRLLIGQPQLSEVMECGDNADIAIALLHHPLSDLMEFDEGNTAAHFRAHHDLVLRGHLHDSSALSLKSGRGGYVEIAAGALHERHEAPNRFSIIDIAETLENITVRTFVWKDASWILDRNLYETEDGVGFFEIDRITRKQKPASRESRELASQSTSPLSFSIVRDDRSQEQENSVREIPETVANFPHFQNRPSKQDLSVRQAALSEVMLAIKSNRRDIRVRKDPGSRYEGFIACVAVEFAKQHKNAPVLYLGCGGVSTGKDLQDALAVNAQASITNFAAALRSTGPCILVLDDLNHIPDDGKGGVATVDETVQALLDFCESLVIIRVSALPLEGETLIRIGVLDLPDTREYLENAPKAATFRSTVDIARVHRVTGGLPVHLDAVIDALGVTTLEGALSQVDAEIAPTTESLPPVIVHEVDTLKTITDPEFVRIRHLLWALSILERGESLATIKRLDSRNPIWPKHATYLEKKGCLDVVEADAAYYGATPSRHPSSGDKILRVPRMVRDYVISIMSHEERRNLLRSAAVLYFGSDWRIGVVRMRRRIAFSNEIVTHRSSNEMTVLRALASDSGEFFANSGSTPYGLALSYISQLKAKGFYGEAYEASREFLGIASSGMPIVSPVELQHLQILAGSCARMIGEREACVEFLSDALPSVRRSSNKSLLSDVLIDLALALDGVDKHRDSARYAEEILAITPKESSDYFQAKAILAAADGNKQSRIETLKQLAIRARNLRHHTVADNIVLDLASEVDDTENKLRFLSEVKSRGEREYNYVRATIRRVETLLDAGREHAITELDVKDLWHSYSLAYSQRMSGIFDWCHRVCWRYLDETGQHENQTELFMVSSFVWRLNGNRELEQSYLEKLDSQRLDTSKIGERLVRLLTYCKSRLRAIKDRPAEGANA